MKTISTHAATAKAIRKELKQAFPSIKFSVRSSSFSGGDSIHIEWQNGPTEDQISSIVGKYEYGHFDAMFDIYEISNRRKDIPQVKYVQWRRNISDDLLQAKFEEYKRTHADCENINNMHELIRNDKGYVWSPYERIMRDLDKIDLTNKI